MGNPVVHVELGTARADGPGQVGSHTGTVALRDPAANPSGIYHHGPH